MQARLVEAIAADGAKVIGLDLVSSEPEVTALLRSLRALSAEAGRAAAASPALREALRHRLEKADTDRLFARTLARAGNVVLALPLSVPEANASAGIAPGGPAGPAYLKRATFMLVRETSTGESLAPFLATGALAPLKPFAEGTISLGHVYSLPDRDGVTRYESLRCAMATSPTTIRPWAWR